MRYISIDLSSDNHLQQPKIFGGYAGEHNETILQVKLPDRMVDIECSGYRFDFQTSEDNKIPSMLIPPSELEDGVLSFRLSEQFTVAGKLIFNVAAILLERETVSLISKTNSVTLYIEDSPTGHTQLIDFNSYKDEFVEMVDGRIRTNQNKILDYITYEIINRTVTITGYYKSLSGSYIIPDMIEGYPVTSIGSHAFENCKNLTSITMSNSITSIGEYAFNRCESLINVILPNRITSIPTHCFNKCYNLINITIPDSIARIEKAAFSEAGSRVTGSRNLYYMGSQEQWSNININKTANERIDPSTPQGANLIMHYNQALTTRAEVNKIIGELASSGLTRKIVDELPLENISETTIYMVLSNIPDESNVYDEYMFINGGWELIGSTAVDLTDYVTKDEMQTGLNNKADKNPILKYLTYEINDNTVTITGCDTLISGSHTIPDTIEGYPVTAIRRCAFEEAIELVSIAIPDSVVDIGDCAFKNCLNLTSITLPNGITTIKYATFEGCNLTSITIPDSVTSIDDLALDTYNELAIYYMGSEEQWNNISIDAYRENSPNATIYYNQALATREYINEKVGDIETSLENIIAKYGLGGGNV